MLSATSNGGAERADMAANLPSTAIDIRAAGPGDAEAIAMLHAASWKRAYRGMLPDAYLDGPMSAEKEAHWRAKLADLADGDMVLAAERDRELVGFIAVWPDPAVVDGVFIDNLHAIAEAHGQGVGRALFFEAVRRAVAAGRRQAWLSCYPDNTRAVSFYKRVGGVPGLLLEDRIGDVERPAQVFFWLDLPSLLRDG